MEQKRAPNRKRLRSRRRLNWGPILAALLTVNIMLAGFSSKLTCIRTINLEGVRNSERLRLERLANDIKGIPALKVDPRVVESPFMNETRIQNADFRRNVFGVGRLILVYRKAVASITGCKHTFIDESGVIFTDPEEKSAMPSILLQDQIKVTVMALCGVTNYKHVAELVGIVRASFPETLSGANPVEIEVQETGGLCLNMNSGIVILGTNENMTQKVEKLKQVFQENPDIFIENISINMMNPNNPQKTKRKKESG